MGQIIQEKTDEVSEGEKRKGEGDRGGRGDNRHDYNRLLNQRGATALFDSGADKSFVSTNFSTLIDIEPVELDTCYDVELADGQVVSTNNVLIGCILNLLNHSFPIDLMVIELGSFDIIIGIDWLSRYDVAILCREKKVRISPR
ncbi:putative reverse transcriptase domain-containing protein, partial [Tanacetum coccineum]